MPSAERALRRLADPDPWVYCATTAGGRFSPPNRSRLKSTFTPAGAPREATMSRKVFISYSSSEAGRVRILAQDIQNLGHAVWFDHELSGGQRWWDQILQEIRE